VFGVEIGRSVRRLRTYVFGAGLAALAILPVVVLSTSGSGGGGPLFFDRIRDNGLFAALAVLVLLEPFFLPLGTSLLSGEAIAGEASLGTLRYLVVRPVGRVRLVAHKYLAIMAQLAAAVLWVMILGLVAGGIAFGYGPLPTLSGATLGTGSALLRIAATGLYVLLQMSGLAAIGMFISTMTDAGLGAAGSTMAIAITSQILDSLSSMRVIHPYLISHQWLAFADLFRTPVEWQGIEQGLVLAGVYTAVFLGGAMLVFSRKDVVS
jgi:ABC-2 type transport system permease protein